MKALFFNEHGDADVLKYGELHDPIALTSGQARVKVKAVALNHLDIWVRRGWPGLNLKMPHITGADISGVDEINGDGGAITEGDRVIVFPGVYEKEDEWVRRGLESLSPTYSVLGEHHPGGCAEYITVPIRNLHSITSSQSFEEAAAPNLVLTTAWRMLFSQGDLQPGENVLVVGSGGGVNSVSIQLASASGARVIALAGSEKKAKAAVELGAHDTILYNKVEDWHRLVLKLTDGRGVDLVVDNVGEATFLKSLKALRKGGRLLTVGNTSGYNLSLDNRLIFAKQLSIVGSTMGSRQDLIDAIAFMQLHGKSVAIDTVAGLSEGKRMMERLERGDHFGKIVLVPGD